MTMSVAKRVMYEGQVWEVLWSTNHVYRIWQDDNLNTAQTVQILDTQPAPPACTCGATTARTVHSYWCDMEKYLWGEDGSTLIPDGGTYGER